MSDVILYSKPACGKCVVVKAALKKRGVGFVEINALEDDTALAFLRENDVKEFPILQVGHTLYRGMQSQLDKITELAQ